jgi:ribosomal protein L16 Arg81 hydroxylase
MSSDRGPARKAPALSRCTALPAGEFADRIWSTLPLLTPGHDLAGSFDDLFSPDAVDELVSRRGLRTPFLRMAKNGTVLPASSYTRSGGSGATIADQVADDRVLALLADGATLVLQALHRTWPPLVSFGSALAAEIGHPVQINAYITPAQNQGFSAHYDTHDVFVLQVAGTKQWTIHEPVLDDPLPDQVWDQHRSAVERRAAEPPLIDALLKPGDALYLPRGYLHSAVAQGELSIHLTVGIHPITSYDLVRDLLSAARNDRELRRSLPMGVDLGDPAVLGDALRAAANRLAVVATAAEDDQLDAIARRVGTELSRNTRPQPVSPLAQLTRLETLAVDSALVLRPDLRADLRPTGDRVTVSFLGTGVTWPGYCRDALVHVLTGVRFVPGDLPGLPDDDRLALVRRLLREGIVVPADAVANASG